MRCCGCVQLQILRLLRYPGTKENETYPVLQAHNTLTGMERRTYRGDLDVKGGYGVVICKCCLTDAG